MILTDSCQVCGGEIYTDADATWDPGLIWVHVYWDAQETEYHDATPIERNE